MYKKLYTFSLLIITLSTFSSHIPKLPLMKINEEMLPIKNLDTNLNGRFWTMVDQLDEDLEDVILTDTQQDTLNFLRNRQKEIYQYYKIIYASFIQEQIHSTSFNKTTTISRTINNFRRDVQTKTNIELGTKATALQQEILNSSHLTATAAAQLDSRRRKRS
ncbi:hypothetical protein HYV10_03280 [Candidatus Dependentiae bacterium]|nr:hypothetical protein [Candidatus Dependentiae bacterium]